MYLARAVACEEPLKRVGMIESLIKSDGWWATEAAERKGFYKQEWAFHVAIAPSAPFHPGDNLFFRQTELARKNLCSSQISGRFFGLKIDFVL